MVHESEGQVTYSNALKCYEMMSAYSVDPWSVLVKCIHFMTLIVLNNYFQFCYSHFQDVKIFYNSEFLAQI